MFEGIWNVNSEKGKGIVSFLNQLAFLGSNAILYFIFSYFSDIGILVFLGASIVSFILIGKVRQWQSFAWLFGTFTLFLFLIGNNNMIIAVGLGLVWLIITGYLFLRFAEKTQREGQMGLKASKNIALKFCLIAPRLMFFSVAYTLFPTLVVWSAIFGIGFFTEYIKLTRGVDALLGMLTAFGIILGFFQFYLQRYEDKIQQKMTTDFAELIFPKEEFSYPEFKKFISGKTKFESIEKIRKDIEDNAGLRYLSDSVARRTVGKPIVQLFVSNVDTTQTNEFKLIETKAEKENKSQQLIDAYKEFFDEKTNKIMRETNKEKVDEMMWLFVGNLNILDESYPALLTINKPKEKPETYGEFVFSAASKIINKIFKDFFK